MTVRAKRKRGPERWARLSDTELLEFRFCELGLSIRNEPIAGDIQALYDSLERRGIRFRPHVWLSTEWFSPDGIPGIAVPFFAAHPRLSRLERRLKGEAEGTNSRWRTRILRHEAGHALDTAYRLRRRRDWRTVFGRASKPYPSWYGVRPASRRFVQHLGHWYAQSHPTEDFAETFAVWLQPKARWRRAYAGWPALAKLEYVDALMEEIAEQPPLNRNRSIVASLKDNRRTLREHYRRSSAVVLADERRYDAWLTRTFTTREKRPAGKSASSFLRRLEPKLRRRLGTDSAIGDYLFTHVADLLRRRARELDLVLRSTQREAIGPAVRLHERVAADVLRRNRERYIL